MAQWANHLRNNIFVNLAPLPLLCKLSGTVHLAQPGLMAGWLAGWLAGRQAGWQAGRRNTGEFRNFKVGCRSKYSTCRFVYPRYIIIGALPMHSSQFFWVKPIARLIFKAQNFPEAIRFPTNPYYEVLPYLMID